METVAIVKASKPIYNANSFTKHKKVYLKTLSKTSFDTKHKKVNKECTAMSSQVPGCHYMAVLISSDLFALIPFIFAVCITETAGHTKSNIINTVQKTQRK